MQGMGVQRTFGICSSCAKQNLQKINHPSKQLTKRGILFVVLILLGIAATVSFRHSPQLFSRLLGPIAILCGCIGIFASVKESISIKREYENLNDKDRMEHSAWNLFLRDVPRKNGEQDITYIPINHNTCQMNESELSAQYDLLPAIASKVYHKLRKES